MHKIMLMAALAIGNPLPLRIAADAYSTHLAHARPAVHATTTLMDPDFNIHFCGKLYG